MQKQWHTDNPENCPMVYSLNVIGGKWKPVILHMLVDGIMRFGELKKNIPPVTQKMLTQQLRQLENDGLVYRKVYAEVPPRVEYSLTDKGKTLVPVLDQLYQWGAEHRD